MKKILIIGGGVSGLTAGILAQKQGYSTIIAEKHSVVGGNLTGWERDGYNIDNCIHWLTGTNKKSSEYKKLKELGVVDNFHFHNSFYTAHLNGQSLSMSKDLDKTKEQMLKISESDKTEILRFINTIKSVKYLQNMGGESNNLKGTILQKAKAIYNLLYYYNKNLDDLANKFKHPLLKLCINGFIGGDFSSLGLIFAYACFCEGNGQIPYGGSKQMADTIKEKYLSLGGKIITNAKAIKVNNKSDCISVDFIDKPTLYCDYLVLATDIENAYKLTGKTIPKNIQKRLYNPKFKRFSSFHVAFSCDIENLNFRGEQILFVGDKYKDLIKAKTIAVREFSYEKTFAPQGKTIIQAMFFVNENDSQKWINLRNDASLYFNKKLKLSQTIMDIIGENFSILKGNLKIIDVWTPATYNRYYSEKNGSYMSNILPKSTIPTTFKNTIKGYKNTVIASQWLSLIGGLPIAINSGYKAIKTISKMDIQKQPFYKFKRVKAIKQ